MKERMSLAKFERWIGEAEGIRFLYNTSDGFGKTSCAYATISFPPPYVVRCANAVVFLDENGNRMAIDGITGVTKETDSDTMIDTYVFEGRRYSSPVEKYRFTIMKDNVKRPPVVRENGIYLTAMQLEVLRRLAGGMTTGEAADAIGVSVSTVKECSKIASLRLHALLCQAIAPAYDPDEPYYLSIVCGTPNGARARKAVEDVEYQDVLKVLKEFEELADEYARLVEEAQNADE